MGDVQLVVHAAEEVDEEGDLLVVVFAAQAHVVRNDAVAFLSGFIFRVESDDLGQVHGVGGAVDDVCAAVRESGAGLVSHGVDDSQQGVGERHTGQALGVMHPVALVHVAVVGIHQVVLDGFDGENGQRVGISAVGGGNISLDGVGHGVHTGVGHQLLGHGFGQVGVHDGHVGGDLKVRDGIFDALLVIGDDREGRHLGSGAGGGGNGAEMGFLAEFRQAENLAHILEGDVRVFVFDPHGLSRVDGGAAAHGDDPVGLELLHGLGALHNGFNGGVRLDAFKQLYFHAGFLQVRNGFVQEAEFLHGAAADADDGPFSFQCFQSLQGAFAVV